MTHLAATPSIQRSLRHLALSLLLLPALAFAGAETLLDEAAVTAQIGKTPEYQLLDARGAEAQRGAPLAFSTRYQPLMPVSKGTVFVVADTDGEAQKIAAGIPAEGRSVFAVKGGAAAWKSAIAKKPAASAMPDSFVIPKNTCESGSTITELKSDKAIQKEKKK